MPTLSALIITASEHLDPDHQSAIWPDPTEWDGRPLDEQARDLCALLDARDDDPEAARLSAEIDRALCGDEDDRDAEMIAALQDIVEPTWRGRGRYSVPGYAPDSSDDAYSDDNGDPDTSPGSPWDKECDRLLAEVQRALPAGWTAEWSDDDLLIEHAS